MDDSRSGDTPPPDDHLDPDDAPTRWASVRPEGAIGPYRLVQKLGEGGMGEVWLAEQTEPVRRRVALKIIKHGMDTREVVARFETERQALALMDHRGIARVHDAGSAPGGRPYFVMEYVAGIPINEYCDKNRLDVDARLDLFREVCEAVQHAHQKGIIHRDLKPSNILVATKDDRPVPKVIDFGVAKATAQHMSDRSHYTEVGKIIGTPEYMSPEQADLGGLDIDSRSDIYSLGVVLYELLVGALPLDTRSLREAGYAEIQRRIREEDPALPSLRITTQTATAVDVARLRRSDVKALARRLRGDLDWIVMKALEKDPAHRYASASEFAADIERHLRNEPVLAGRPGLGYKLTKFARRNRGLVIAAATVLAALVVGLAGTTTMYLRARKAEARATAARVEAVQSSYRANLLAAKLSIGAGDLNEARRRLLECDEDLRGWEWRHLFLRTDSSHMALTGEHESVASVFYGDGGDIIVSADDTRLVFWDRRSGEAVSTTDLRETTGIDEESAILGVSAVSPDAGCAAIHAGYDEGRRLNRFAVIDAGDGSVRATYEQEFIVAPALARGCGSMAVFLAGDESRIEIVDLGSGGVLHAIPWGRRPGDVTVMRFSDDGEHLGVGTSKGVLAVVETATGRMLSSWRPGRRPIGALALGHDVIVAGASDGNISVSWLDGKPVVGSLRAHEAGVTALALAPDGSVFATGSSDRSVSLWDLASGRRTATLVGSRAKITALAIDPRGGELVAAGQDGALRTWTLPALQPVRRVRVDDVAYALAPGASGDLMIAGLGSDSLAFVDLASAEIGLSSWDGAVTTAGLSLMTRMPGMGSSTGSLAVTEDGRHVARWSVEGEVQVWDALTRQRRGALPLEKDAVAYAVTFSPDDRLLALADENGIQLWDWREAAPAGTLGPENAPTLAMAFSPDGRRLVSSHRHNGTSRGEVIVWDVETRERVLDLPAEDQAFGTFAFHPSGDRLFGGRTGVPGGASRIAVWNLTTGSLEASLEGHQQPVTSLDIHPGGHCLASGSTEGTIRLWDAERLGPLLVLDDYPERVVAVAFSGDGSRLLSSHQDRSLLSWEVPPGAAGN